MNEKKSVSVFFCFVLGIMFLLVMCSSAVGVMRTMEEENVTSWEGELYYPLEKTDGFTKQDNTIIDVIEDLFALIEHEASADGFEYRMPFILVAKMADKMAGLDMTASLSAGQNDKNDSTDVVLEYQDEWLGWIYDEESDITNSLNSLVEFAKGVDSQNKNFLFMCVPNKYRGNEIYKDSSEVYYKQLVSGLQAEDIAYSDMTAEWEKSNSLENAFYKTDHHWTAETGLWACTTLCKEMNERFGYAFDTSIFSLENYDRHEYKGVFLGSLGKKVTEVYTTPEDFNLYVPNYPTDVTVFMSKTNEEMRGTVEETMFNYDVLKSNDLYNQDMYGFYGSDQALMKIYNNEIEDGSHILLIKNSMAKVVVPYLSSAVNQLDVIDLRYFDGSLQKYMDETNPDTVIVMYGLNNFVNNEGEFDFR